MKRDNITKLNIKLRIELFMVCMVLIFTFFVGCTSNGEEGKVDPKSEETLESMEEPLRVLYDVRTESFINNFMSANPEVNIELIKCMNFVDDEIDMEEIINQYGVPDLVIGSEEISGYLPSWYHNGYIADLGEFCASDTSIDTDAYFPETFTVFREDERLYALPLGITMDFILTSESKYSDSAFVQLEQGYTGKELVDVLLQEVQEIKESGELFSEYAESPLRWMYRLNGVTRTENGIQMDEELFDQVYRFAYQNRKLRDEAKNFWTEQGIEFSSSNGYTFPCSLEPRRYEGKFAVDIGGLEDAPAMVLSYAETIYQYYTEEGVKAIYLPSMDDGNKYQARVKIWGTVAENSSNKELAYELLRALMDEEANYFERVRGANPNGPNVYPINKASAMSLLDNFEKQFAELTFGSEGTDYLVSVERIGVSDEEKAKHEAMLNNISGLYCWTEDLSEVAKIFDIYVEANIVDYEKCYQDMLNTLNSDDFSEGISILSEIKNEENSYVVETKRNETAEAEELKDIIRNIKVGETFFFGETEQDGDIENGAEPIEWIILEKADNKAFVVSRKIIEWLTFSKYDAMVDVAGGREGFYCDFTWNIDKNQQHDWLMNELYEKGFTESEKEIIILTRNFTKDIRASELESDDYLYIPSKEDIEEYMPDINMRKAEITAYVAEKANQVEGEFGAWSLRTILMTNEGWNYRYTRQINEEGEFGATYTSVPNGVRPVMWLDIS